MGRMVDKWLSCSSLSTVVLGLCVALCWRGAACQSDSNSEGASAPQEKNQVSLYISLHDKKARPLTDLKPGDLAITDAGHAVDSSELRINQDATAGDHVITLFFNRLDAVGAKNAARSAKAILKNLGENTGPIGVWAIGDRFRVVQCYTTDRALVMRAIDEVADGPLVVATAGVEQEKQLAAAQSAGDADARTLTQKKWDTSSIMALNEAQRVAVEEHVPVGVAGLFAAARAQRDLKGRKAIIYFTQVVPSDLNAADQFRSASQKLRDASVSVFAVDLNAIDQGAAESMQAVAAMSAQQSLVRSATFDAPKPLAGTTAATPGATNMGLGDNAFRMMNDTIAGIEFDGLKGNENLLAQLALATGGAYTNADANSKKICRQLLGELTSYYTVTYPVASRYDGRFHPVVIKPLRAGVKVDEHPGYFGVRADAAANPTTASSPEAAPIEAGEFNIASLGDGATSADLSLKAAMLQLGKVSAGIHSVLALEIPIRQLELHEDPNTALSSLHASVAVEVKDASGKTVARFHEEFRRHGSSHAAEKLRSGVLSMERSLTLAPGDYQLEAAVRDWNADTIGKSTQTIHLAEAEGADALSDLVLVRSMDKRDDAGSDALPYGQEQVVPNLSGELPGETGEASLYFQLYSNEKKADSEKLHLEIAKDGKLLATLPMHTQTVRANEVSSRMANVTLSGSGTYELTLCLERDGHTTRRRLSVVSEGSNASNSDADAGHVELAKYEPPSIELDLKTTTGRKLAPQESIALVSDARERALAYTHSLPNFMCVESIDRSYDPRGSGVWKHRDSIVELLRYADKNETRTVLEIDGKKSHMDAENIEGAHSNGEFGGILGIIFDPASNAAFEWQKTDEKDGLVLQVYSYKIDAAKSQFCLTDHSSSQVCAPFHGLVLIDNDTHAVRRLVAQTDALPKDFGIKSSWMSIDYDYIAINGHDYLLPTSGEVGLQEGRRMAVSNQLRFSNYRRFGSHARILGNGPITDKPLQ